MTDWKSTLKADPTNWLLEPENPSVRYFTLKEILDRSLADPEVKQSRTMIMKAGKVPTILTRQKEGGYWEKAEDFYLRTKYKGTVWTFILLAELGADGQNRRIQKAGEFILTYSQDRKSGGFAYRGSKTGGGQHNSVLPCLTANMTWCFIRFGYLNDTRVRQAIDWIVRHQRFDDGDGPSLQGWPYDSKESCYGRHTCLMGIVKSLKALAEIPAPERADDVTKTIEEGAEFLLRHHLFKRSHDLAAVAKPAWLRFSFPRMWGTDALEMLDILAALGLTDPRMREAMELVLVKQDEKGRWLLENTLKGRLQVEIEPPGRPSKWVSLQALRAIKRYSGS